MESFWGGLEVSGAVPALLLRCSSVVARHVDLGEVLGSFLLDVQGEVPGRALQLESKPLYSSG